MTFLLNPTQHVVAKSKIQIKLPLFLRASSLKNDYLCALEYFLRKYGENDENARAAFKVYKQNKNSYSYCGDEKALDLIHSFLGAKFDLLSAYYRRYRACLFMDCLFILAYSNHDKAKRILNDFCNLSTNKINKNNKRNSKFFQKLFDYLYSNNHSDNHSEPLKGFSVVKNQIEAWDAEKIFEQKPLRKIMFTASMSAGKSTIINAIVGKKITQTQSKACTGKIHSIYNKPFEDGLSAKFENSLNMNASQSQLLTYESDNQNLKVWTYFRTFLSNDFRWCLIDTPGVNFSMNSQHLELTHRAIENQDYDFLIYVVNAEYVSTSDDKKHLEYVFQKVPSDKIIFVLNKLDSYDSEDDSIPEAISTLKSEIEKIGFKNPAIFPTSAYAAALAKKRLFTEKNNFTEKNEFYSLSLQFKQPDYDLSGYAKNLNDDDKIFLTQTFSEKINKVIPKKLFKRARLDKKTVSDCYNLLVHSGIVNLEKFLGINTIE